MTGNDETQGRIVYSKKLSDYFYPKLSAIDNENPITNENDFDENDISEYGLDENNGEIDISSTKKLIKYLRSLIDVNIEKLDLKVDTKLDIVDYVIDNQISSTSQNPLANNVIYNLFESINSTLNTKANIRHTHSISDVTSLDTLIDSKANATDLSNHISNKSNPHGVTLSQLGISDSNWDSIPLTQSSLSASSFPYCRKYGKMVMLDFHGELYKKFAKNTTVFTLKSQYRPNHTVYGFGYKVGSGACFTYTLDPSGNLKFGADLANGTNIRITECYFTS